MAPKVIFCIANKVESTGKIEQHFKKNYPIGYCADINTYETCHAASQVDSTVNQQSFPIAINIKRSAKKHSLNSCCKQNALMLQQLLCVKRWRGGSWGWWWWWKWLVGLWWFSCYWMKRFSVHYIVADSGAPFDVRYATLAYHVLCRHKHADLFEAGRPRQPGSTSSCSHTKMWRGCRPEPFNLLWTVVEVSKSSILATFVQFQLLLMRPWSKKVACIFFCYTCIDRITRQMKSAQFFFSFF